MSKLKIEQGASRTRRAPLKTTIDGTVSDDLELMCKWSENDTSYIVNHLLRFALSQSEDFQQYKRLLRKDSSISPKALQAERSTVATAAARAPEVGR